MCVDRSCAGVRLGLETGAVPAAEMCAVQASPSLLHGHRQHPPNQAPATAVPSMPPSSTSAVSPTPTTHAPVPSHQRLSVVWCRIEASVVGWSGSLAVSITNQQVTEHAFLQGLYADDYFPDQVVDKGKAILLRLCERIEAERPSDLAALYVLTGSATEEFNALEAEFEAAGSEIETVAREEIAEDFGFVRRNLDTGELEWKPFTVCTTCQGKYPPTLFPPGTRGASGGAWGD